MTRPNESRIELTAAMSGYLVQGVLGMIGIRLAGCVLAFSLPLFAQQTLNERRLGAYKGDDQAVRSAMNYCDAIDDAVQGQQPRIFAGLKDLATKSPGDWKEVASRDEWDAAGKPGPLAFVWNRDGAIVRVTIVWGPPRVGAPAATRRRVTYCYGTDSKLCGFARCGPLQPTASFFSRADS